jgi:anti-sigma factor RsiW
MNARVEPIADVDLYAYVDDELPLVRRIEVEACICHHPEKAARVMADLRIRDELRLALANVPRAGRPATTDAARRLERGIAWARIFRRAQKIAAVAILSCRRLGRSRRAWSIGDQPRCRVPAPTHLCLGPCDGSPHDPRSRSPAFTA